MDKKEGRQARLIQTIRTEGMLPVRMLANILSVTEMTIRRDLAELGAQNRLEPNSDSSEKMGYDLLTSLQKSYEQKLEIGKLAASLIRPDEFIIIDTGSTTARMLQYLPEDYNLSVLCYNTNILVELRYKMGIKLMFCGGTYHRSTEMFESPEGIQFIKRVRASKVFLSAAGVHRQLGITCAFEYEIPTKQAIIQSSLERILLVDSSKFDQVKPSYICELADVNAIITDKGIPDEWQKHIRDGGINLYLA